MAMGNKLIFILVIIAVLQTAQGKNNNLLKKIYKALKLPKESTYLQDIVDIADNKAEVASNSIDIASNTVDISDNAAAISNNDADILSISNQVASNTQQIQQLGDPCKDISYALLSAALRHRDQTGPHGCDKAGHPVPGEWQGEGWYRFVDGAGNQMADSPVTGGRGYCGAHAQGYMTGAHPTILGESVIRTVCFYLDNTSCWRTTDVEIKMCLGYYLYKLKDLTFCSSRYCGQ